jgi:hypothetical protein
VSEPVADRSSAAGGPGTASLESPPGGQLRCSRDGSTVATAAAMLFECASFLVNRAGRAAADIDPERLRRVTVQLLQRRRVDPGTEPNDADLVSSWIRRALKSALPFVKGGVTPHDTIDTSSRPRARAEYTSGTTLAAISHGVRRASNFNGPIRLSTALVTTAALVLSNGSELLCDRASCSSRASRMGRGSSSDRFTRREQRACATRSKELPGLRPKDMDERTNDCSTAIRRTSSPSTARTGGGAALAASSIIAVVYPLTRSANMAVQTRQPTAKSSQRVLVPERRRPVDEVTSTIDDGRSGGLWKVEPVSPQLASSNPRPP